MRLVITEKPSVARDLARVLGVSGRGNGCIEGPNLCITWCIGHLLELEQPSAYRPEWKSWRMAELPMVPDTFRLRPRKTAADQWKVVKRLLKDKRFTSVVNACDAGREGELIFRYAYQLSGSKAPVERFWVSSLTDKAIRAGWEAIGPAAAYDPLADAARCRSESDWLVGLNATRAMTCKVQAAGGNALLSVGRVQTPTLAMIVARDQEIEAFVSEPFWQVKAEFQAERDEETTWKATWYRTGAAAEPVRKGEVDRAERIARAEHAEALRRAVSGRTGKVVLATRKERRDPPPLLYDLTELQRRANRRYKMSADHTLNIAQELYEKHKLLTYPRTDARYLTTDQVDQIPEVLQGLSALDVYRPFVEQILEQGITPSKRWVNDAEVGDHHAIIPTGRRPNPSGLSPDAKRIFDLVARRTMAALMPHAVIDTAKIEVEVPVDVELPPELGGTPRFRARGRVIREPGWQVVDPPAKRKDTLLPHVEQGDSAAVLSAEGKQGQTRPPKPHDDASLLKAMELAGRDLDDAQLKRALRGAGLGTPATRAAVILTLLQRKYVVRRQGALRATEKGTALIQAVPVTELKSAELTGRWEARLSKMADGKEDRAAFMQAVTEHLHGIIDAIRNAPEVPPLKDPDRERKVGRSLGKCPVCGTKVADRGPVFACDTGRECAFVVFKTMCKRKIPAKAVKAMLKDGVSDPLKGFKSKKGTDFDAALRWDGDAGRVQFVFADRKATPPPPAGPAPKKSLDPVGMPCPRCDGHVIAGRAAWGCSNFRSGCEFRVSFADTPPEKLAGDLSRNKESAWS